MGRVIRDVSQQRRCQRWLLLSNGSSFDHVVQFAHSEYRKVSTSCIFDRIPIQLILIKISPTILRIRISLMSPECRSLLSIFFAIRLQLSSKIQFPYSISSSHVTSLFPRCSFCLNTIECVRYRYICLREYSTEITSDHIAKIEASFSSRQRDRSPNAVRMCTVDIRHIPYSRRRRRLVTDSSTSSSNSYMCHRNNYMHTLFHGSQ